MGIYICVLIFLFLLLFPFVPGWLEIKRCRDDESLYINADYTKNPRYFAQSFREILKNKGVNFTDLDTEKEIFLSKKEIIECCDTKVKQEKIFHQIAVLNNEAITQSGSVFQKEVLAFSNLVLSGNTSLRAAACYKDCYLLEGVKVLRWIDADNDLFINDNCDLGISASAGGQMNLGKSCVFHRLYAQAIYIGVQSAVKPQIMEACSYKKNIYRYEEVQNILEQKVIPGSIVFKGDLELKPGTIVQGSIKAEGKLTLNDGVQVAGNIFGEEDMVFSKNIMVLGSVFTQGKLQAGSDCVFGALGAISSVIARKGMVLGLGNIIYGYVSTEGKGVTA